MNTASPPRIPITLKLGYTAFIALLTPIYWINYGPTNFLYFCDMALFLTLAALWTESSLAASMAAVGIVLPQLFWCVDFACEGMGFHLSRMTSYMFDGSKPLHLRALSLFHGWLPFVLLFILGRLGYDRRALGAWTPLAVVLCLIAYFCLPPSGALLANPNTPRDVNYVFGLNEAQPQHWLSPMMYLFTWMAALWLLLFLPSHLILRRFFAAPRIG